MLNEKALNQFRANKACRCWMKARGKMVFQPSTRHNDEHDYDNFHQTSDKKIAF
jgi:hypothetical protein